MKKVLFSMLLASVIFLVSGFTVNAQETALNVTVSPVFLDLTASPGDTINQKFRVRNNTSSPIDLAVSVDKLISKGENGNVVPAARGAEDGYLSWIKFDKDTVTAAPREWTDLTFKIEVPKEAAFGYYFAVHLSQKAGAQKPGEQAAKLLGEVVFPILLNIKSPNAKIDAKLAEFKASSFVNEYLPINFVTRIRNDGNVHVAPRGNIFIRTLGAKDLAVLDVNPGAGNILPGGIREYDASWDDGFMVNTPLTDASGNIKTDKDGKPITQLTFNWDKLTHLRIGKYTADLILVYDNGTRDVTIEGTTTFWVIPYKMIAGGIIGLIVFFFIFRFFLKRYIAAQIKKAGR